MYDEDRVLPYFVWAGVSGRCDALYFVLVGVMCELKIPIKYVTNSLDTKIALEVLKVSPVNTVVSSLLIKFPLCKLSSIGRAQAKFELMSAFGFPTENMTANCYKQFRRRMILMKKADFLTTTKIYLNESLDVDPSFIANSTELYGLRVDKVGFRYSTAASQFMNTQIEREMLKRVTDVIDANEVNINTSMVILNAAHYKGTWEKPFYPQLTKDKNFHNLKGEISKTAMMVTMEDVPFLDEPNLDIKMITLPFLQESITFVMPLNASHLPFFIDKIHKDTELMKQLKSRMSRKVINVSIPKFKIKTYVDWTGFLRLIGINQIMNTTYSGLHHMLKRGSTSNVHLSKIKQKIVIELDEFGIRRPQRLEDIREFKRAQNFMDRADEVLLDRPFYFVISFRDRTGDYDMLQGAYYGPNEI